MFGWSVAVVAAAMVGLVLVARAGAEEASVGVDVGKPGPAFRLNDHAGKGVAVGGKAKGWTVIAFYPKAMTPGCTKEVCSLRDAANDFAELGVQAYGVSTDDVVSCAEFVKQQSLNFPLLSDPDGSVVAKYGVGMPGKPYAARVTFVLDPEGVVRHVDRAVDVTAHGSALVGVVRRLKGS